MTVRRRVAEVRPFEEHGCRLIFFFLVKFVFFMRSPSRFIASPFRIVEDQPIGHCSARELEDGRGTRPTRRVGIAHQR